MTVCVGVAVHDCLVFAADSATSLIDTDVATGASRILNVYKHGNKVFNLHKALPIAAMTCGMGNIGTASIAILAKELRQLFMSGDADWKLDCSSYSIADVAMKARRLIFEKRYGSLMPPPPAPHSLEFWIGGYNADRESGHEVWKIEIVNGACSDPVQLGGQGETGLFFGSQPSPINRLVLGFDQGLFDALKDSGLDDNSAMSLVAYLRSKLEVQLVAPTMPVQDAIELAEFLVDTTKRFFRFLPGADVVGGETDVAVVTRYEGFKWIRRKHYYPARLNPLETSHV